MSVPYRHLFLLLRWLVALCLILGTGLYRIKSTRMVWKPSATRQHVKVILLTYMRSGSSLTGSILSAHPEVFYLFEPLRLINKNTKRSFNFLNMKNQYYKDGHKELLRLSTTGAMLNCSFDDVNVDTLMDTFVVKHSRKTFNYFQCIKEHQGVNGLLYCLPSLYHACESSKVTVVKTIRLSMAEAEVIMKNDTDVKILYLMRDPRATLVSQTRFKIKKYDGFTDHVKSVCFKMASDIHDFETLQKVYPTRVRFVLYEHLLSDPTRVVQQLYEFMGASNYSQYEGDLSYCTICKGHGVNKSLIDAWRKEINYNKTVFIQRICSSALDQLGYLTFLSKKEYFDTSLSLYPKPRL